MEIFMKFLDRKVKEAEEEITKTGILSDDKAIPLMLKTQFNHIAHLEESMDGEFGHIRLQFKEIKKEMDERFKEVEFQFKEIHKEMDGRFKEVDQRFERLEEKFERRFDEFGKMAFRGFGALATLMTVLHFIR